MTFLIEMVKLGLGSLRLHLLRSILTALGIILGVGAVITMVSVGEGSKREALEQLERLGAKNIIIRSQKPPEASTARSGQRQSFENRFGITRQDLELIRSTFPDAESIVPLKLVGAQVLREDRRQSSQTYGTTPELLEVAMLRVARGRYLTADDMREASMVAVLGAEVARTMYPFEDPVGQTIRIDERVFKVVGVLQPVGLSGGAGGALVGRDLNLDIHIPLSTSDVVFGDRIFRRMGGTREVTNTQLSEVYLTAPSREDVIRYASIAKRTMEVSHPELSDISLVVPYELLEAARKNALTWNLVLGAIASISLVVGGIGIMNIMLASVTERTREIGIRRALGATRRHIKLQFLVETGVLSAIGGLLGVTLGIGFSFVIAWGVPRLSRMPAVGWLFPADASLPTHVTLWSVLVAFGVAGATGLIFGLYPALKAAQQDPIVALRHD